MLVQGDNIQFKFESQGRRTNNVDPF